MSDQKYRIKVDEVNVRTSPKLVPTTVQLSEKWGKKLNMTANSTVLPDYSSIRIFAGPKTNLKIICIWRIYSVDPNIYSLVTINIMDMDADLLNPETIFESMQAMSTKIRNVAVHPNGRELIILSEVKVGKYQLRQLIDDDKTYEMVLLKQISFTNTLYDDFQYHPSGKYLIGIKQHNNKTELLPTKLDAKSLQFTMAGQNIKEKCVTMMNGLYRFPVSGILDIDRNQPSKAAIGFRMNTVCLWNLESDKFTIQYKKLDQSLYNFSRISRDLPVSQDITIAGVQYLNSTKDGYLVGFDPTRRLAIQLYGEQSFAFSELMNDNSIVQCIDIDDINSVACFRKNTHGVSIAKIDRTVNRTVSLYSNFKMIPGFRMEAVFYYSKNSQFCQIYDQVLECYRVSTKCIHKMPFTPISECSQQCSQKVKNSFWNPVTMSCQLCNRTCKCSNPYQTFNPYYRSCVLDCSKIPQAAPASAYANHTKCVCNDPYQWFDDLRQCRINCTEVKFSLKYQDESKVQISKCKCPPNFVYYPKPKQQDVPGECILQCPHGKTYLLNQNNQPYCQCSKDEKWQHNSYSCVRLVKKSQPFPVWGIVLILIGVFIVTAAIGFLVRRKCMKDKVKQENKKKQAGGQLQIQQAGQGTNRQLSSKQKQTHNEQKQEQICAVCKKEQNQVNCRAKCGHYYHFFCIKAKIDEGEAQCPECFKVFHKGVADIQLIENDDEIYTISDS